MRSDWFDDMMGLLKHEPFRPFTVRYDGIGLGTIQYKQSVSWNRHDVCFMFTTSHRVIRRNDNDVVIEPIKPTAEDIRAALRATPFVPFVLVMDGQRVPIASPYQAAVSEDGDLIYFSMGNSTDRTASSGVIAIEFITTASEPA